MKIKNYKDVFIAMLIGLFIGFLVVYLISFYNMDPLVFFLLFVGLVILLLLLRRPEYGLILLIAWPFIQGYILGRQGKFFSLLTGGLGVGLIVYLLYQFLFFRLAISHKFKIIIKGKKITFLMILLFVWAFFAAGYGVLKGNELPYVLGDFYWIVTIPFVYFLTIILIKNQKQCKKIFYWAASIILFFFVLDLVKYLQGGFAIGAIISGQGVPRMLTASGPYSMMIFPLTLTFCLFSKGKEKWLWLLAASLTLLVLITSLTRTYWYASVGALIFMFFLFSIREKIRLLYRILPILLIVLLLGSFAVIKLKLGINFMNLIIGRGTAFKPASKFLEVKDIVLQTIQNPLTIFMGEGMGGRIETWVIGPTIHEITLTHFIHNNYARIFLETGIVGLSLYLMIAFVFLKKTIKFFRKSDKNDYFNRSITLGAIGSFVAVLVGAIGTNTLYGTFTYLLMGIIVVIIYQKSEELNLRENKATYEKG